MPRWATGPNGIYGSSKGSEQPWVQSRHPSLAPMNLDIILASRSLVEEAWNQPGKWEANLSSAEAMLAKALIEIPGDVLALTCLGAVLSDLGEHEKAASALQRAVELGSTDRNTHFNLGVARMNCGTHEEAMASFREAKGLQPSPLSWEAYFDPQAH